MEGRLFEDLVVSRGDSRRTGAAGMPFSMVLHAAGLTGLLALSLAVSEDLPAPPGLAIADVVFATGPRAPAAAGPRLPVSRAPRSSPRALAPILEAVEETPEIEPEPFAPDGERDDTAACVGCALRDEGPGKGGGTDRGEDPAADIGTTGAAPVRVGGHIQAPRKIRHVAPSYPDLARRAGVTGVVILECVLDRDGLVQSVQVLSGHPLLNEAAVGAVRQWQYRPTLLNGVPVAVVMTVTVRFTTHAGGGSSWWSRLSRTAVSMPGFPRPGALRPTTGRSRRHSWSRSSPKAAAWPESLGARRSSSRRGCGTSSRCAKTRPST